MGFSERFLCITHQLTKKTGTEDAQVMQVSKFRLNDRAERILLMVIVIVYSRIVNY